MFYQAFNAPKDDIFYLPEDHPDWLMLKSVINEHGILNYPKYKSELRFLMNSVVAGGAAIFKALEEDTLIK